MRSSRQSAATIRQSHRGDNTSTCSSLESTSLASENKHLWNEIHARDRIIAQLRSTIAELEPVTENARAEAAQRDMINVRNMHLCLYIHGHTRINNFCSRVTETKDI
jgi:ABC-type Fe2+-enterobactin transport system substrate-binding protein